MAIADLTKNIGHAYITGFKELVDYYRGVPSQGRRFTRGNNLSSRIGAGLGLALYLSTALLPVIALTKGMDWWMENTGEVGIREVYNAEGGAGQR